MKDLVWSKGTEEFPSKFTGECCGEKLEVECVGFAARMVCPKCGTLSYGEQPGVDYIKNPTKID
jgi:hypothetical protein